VPQVILAHISGKIRKNYIKILVRPPLSPHPALPAAP